MNISSIPQMRSVAIKYSKNEFPPPATITEVVDRNTGDVIRQIPTQSKVAFSKSMAQNSIIDIYV